MLRLGSRSADGPPTAVLWYGIGMRALVWDGTSARVVERPDPELAEGTAIVRVLRAGVCNTDLEIARGYMSFRGVLGHELAGVVERGPERWIGKRVVSEINFACRACERCAKGLARHCATRTVMGILGADGAFAEKIAVPVANLHEVPEGVSDDAAVFAEPLAAAFEILEQVEVEPGSRAVVLGDGKLGLLVSQVLARAGARVLAVGKHPAKLALLRRRGVETALADAFRPEQADLVVEATGSARGLALAMETTRPRGTLVLKSTVADAADVNLAPLVIHEITVVGSRCGPFAPALAALAEGSIDVEPLVSARYALADAEAALARAAAPGVLKVLLAP
jgi:threonine dehydrogenase-like Zn-dependent dehydrogenase